VRFNVVFGRVFRVLGCMNVVTVRHMSMVGGLLVVPLGVRRGGCMMVARSVFVMFRCLGVMLGCFVRHVKPPDCLKNRLLQPRRIIVSPHHGSG